MAGVFWSLATVQTPINEGQTVSPWLARADVVIWWTGLLVAAAIAVAWLAWSRRDPLAKTPPRPNRALPEHVILLMVAFLAAVVILQGAAKLVAAESDLTLTAGNGAQLLGGIACLVAGAKLFDGGLGRFVLGRGRILLRLVQGLVLTFAALTLCNIVYVATEWLIGLAAPRYVPPEHSVIQALRTGGEPAWTLWLGAALIAPVAEELFFRGLAQTVVRNLTNRPWFAVVATGVAFGLVHSQQLHVIPTIAVLGVILGISYERSGSLVAPITVHVLFNTKTLIWEALGAGG